MRWTRVIMRCRDKTRTSDEHVVGSGNRSSDCVFFFPRTWRDACRRRPAFTTRRKVKANVKSASALSFSNPALISHAGRKLLFFFQRERLQNSRKEICPRAFGFGSLRHRLPRNVSHFCISARREKKKRTYKRQCILYVMSRHRVAFHVRIVPLI